MLTVSTTLQSSTIAGIGLFAAQDIQKGEVIWQLDDLTTTQYSIEEWQHILDTLPESALQAFARFGYLREGKWWLNLDDSRFMNHAEKGNVLYCEDTDHCYAACFIKSGEELTCDYTEFDDSGFI